MTKLSKATYVIIAALTIALMAVALLAGLPTYAIIEAQAAEETVYYNYNFAVMKLPIPMNTIKTQENFNNYCAGSRDGQNTYFKIYELTLYEKLSDDSLEKLLIKNVQIAVNEADLGYVFAPTVDGLEVEWGSNNWDILTDTDGNLYSIISDCHCTHSDELIYHDQLLNIAFTTVHSVDTENIIVKVKDLITNKEIYSNKTTNATSLPTQYTSQESTALYEIIYTYRDLETENGAGYATGYQEGYDVGYNSGLAESNEGAYNNGYNQGYEDGEAIGEGIGYDNGYNAGKEVSYQIGYDEGYQKGSYDVNLSITDVTASSIGAFSDLLMQLLNFEVAGISLWGILAIIGGILLVGFIIKLAT